MFKKFPNSTRKFIRLEKARIRRDILDPKKQEEMIKDVYNKLLNKQPIQGNIKKQEVKKMAPVPVPQAQSAASSRDIFQILKNDGPREEIVSTSPEYLKMSLPAAPTTPNIINGLVMDAEGKTMEGAIVEIQDTEGNPIRAMRTNSLGQFQTATPLPNGQYLVLVEKEPFAFAIIKIQAEGKIIAPLQIQAKKSAIV